MSAPTFIEIPEPPSNPDTPSEMPGTPTSTTTSLSALSTTAIKDGHRGSAPLHQHTLSTNTLEAERADRISRLAGLERVATVRPTSGPGGASQSGASALPGYFDAQGNPVYNYKSTVGSASATGSVGGRTTTWASGSVPGQTEDGDEDQMSMDTNFRDVDERDRYSTMDQSEDGDGMSEEGNASLVGFGEGASSTVSGPIYSSNPLPPASSGRDRKSGLSFQQLQAQQAAQAAAQNQAQGFSQQGQAQGLSQGGGLSATPSATPTTMNSALEQRRDAKMTGGVADDSASGGFVDTTTRSPVPVSGNNNLNNSSTPGGAGRVGVEAAERIVRERLDDGEGTRSGGPALGTPDQEGRGLGKFYFEDRK